jgi:ABC-type Fe3+/spermidine/putrescine transport system ATPase subunit
MARALTYTERPAVECRGVTLAYGSIVVVPRLDLEVPAGETVALLGPSGSGKTTMLSAIAGFITIASGEILINGRTVASAVRHEPPERRNVGVVFQGYALWPHLNALDTVAYPIRRRGADAPDARHQAAEILDSLGIGYLAGRRPSELSGGEQQRVGIGRALAREASLYLFDEPTAHLDAALRGRIHVAIAARRKASGAAAIHATHDTAEALAIADRVVLIREGHVVQEGSPAGVYERPVDLWAAELTGPAWVIRMRVVDLHDGQARLEVAGSPQTAALAYEGQTPQGEVHAVVRPDWVRLHGAIPGRVDTVAFHGTHSDYQLATAAGTIGVRVGGPPTVHPGDVVGWSVDRAWIPATPVSGRILRA